MYTHISPNSFLKERNRKFYQGHSSVVHPLLETEYKNSIDSIMSFLKTSVLKRAYYMRLKSIFDLSAENCWNNKNNDYTYSEARMCEELLMEKDSVMANLESFPKEIEVRIKDLYEKQVKYNPENLVDSQNFSIERYEKDHRKFLLKLNYIYRYCYYFMAQKIFIDSVKINK